VGSFISNEDFAVQDEFDEIAPPPVNDCAPVSEIAAAAITEDEEQVDKTAVVAPCLEPVVATAESKSSSLNRRRGWVPLTVIFTLALIIFNGFVFAPADMVPARWRDGVGDWWRSVSAAVEELKTGKIALFRQPGQTGAVRQTQALRDETPKVDDSSTVGSALSSGSMGEAAALIVADLSPAVAEPDFQQLAALPPETESAELAVATAEPVFLEIPEPAPPAFEQRLVLVEFAFDSSELSVEATLQLDEVASSVAAGPQQVHISGYTDSRGDPLYNQRLSGLRAAAVAAYLTESGVDAERLLVEGRGIYDEETALSMQRDRVANIASQRCVEIVFDQQVLVE
jgi:OOP family OmpA-OmpF porin